MNTDKFIMLVTPAIKPPKAPQSCAFSEIMEFLKKESIEHITNLPYNENFTKAMTNGQTIVEYDQGVLKDLIILL